MYQVCLPLLPSLCGCRNRESWGMPHPDEKADCDEVHFVLPLFAFSWRANTAIYRYVDGGYQAKLAR